MRDHGAAGALRIGALTVRAHGLAPAAGSTLARTVAGTLAASASAGRLAPPGPIARITLRLPAAAVGADGRVAAGAIEHALARWLAGADTEQRPHA